MAVIESDIVPCVSYREVNIKINEHSFTCPNICVLISVFGYYCDKARIKDNEHDICPYSNQIQNQKLKLIKSKV